MKRASAESRLLDSPSRDKPGDSATCPPQRGVCRVCGGRDGHAHDEDHGLPCGWLDTGHTLCNFLYCIAVVPMSEIELMVPEIEAT